MARHETPDLRDRLEYLALVSLLRVLRAPSRERGRRWGRWLGRWVSGVAPLRRAVALENLRIAFPEKGEEERRDIYRRMLENLGMMLAEFARFAREPGEPPRTWMRVANPEAFEAAHRAGRGAILLTAHYGNWEGLGAAIADLGYPVTVLGARQRNPLVEALFADYRQRMGIRAITVGESLKPILKTLREGSFVATLADQDGGRQGMFLDFLGRKASVQPGLFRLLVRRRVPLVTGFSFRDGAGWAAELQEPVWPQEVSKEDEIEAEAIRMAMLYVSRVETYIRLRPDHWFWVHRRWKTRPPEGE